MPLAQGRFESFQCLSLSGQCCAYQMKRSQVGWWGCGPCGPRSPADPSENKSTQLPRSLDKGRNPSPSQQPALPGVCNHAWRQPLAPVDSRHREFAEEAPRSRVPAGHDSDWHDPACPCQNSACPRRRGRGRVCRGAVWRSLPSRSGGASRRTGIRATPQRSPTQVRALAMARGPRALRGSRPQGGCDRRASPTVGAARYDAAIPTRLCRARSHGRRCRGRT
jgi:hypothetical protein